MHRLTNGFIVQAKADGRGVVIIADMPRRLLHDLCAVRSNTDTVILGPDTVNLLEDHPETYQSVVVPVSSQKELDSLPVVLPQKWCDYWSDVCIFHRSQSTLRVNKLNLLSGFPRDLHYVMESIRADQERDKPGLFTSFYAPDLLAWAGLPASLSLKEDYPPELCKCTVTYWPHPLGSSKQLLLLLENEPVAVLQYAQPADHDGKGLNQVAWIGRSSARRIQDFLLSCVQPIARESSPQFCRDTKGLENAAGYFSRLP